MHIFNCAYVNIAVPVEKIEFTKITMQRFEKAVLLTTCSEHTNFIRFRKYYKCNYLFRTVLFNGRKIFTVKLETIYTLIKFKILPRCLISL